MTDPSVEVPLTTKTSDLPKRAASAMVMLAVAGTALWLGGWWWTAFVLLAAAGVWFEWSVLAMLGNPPGAARSLWRLGGVVYCGLAAAALIFLREMSAPSVLAIIGAVIATDTFAYFTGRTFGGPKIAPIVSPSKTWSGLFGGIVGTSAVMLTFTKYQCQAQFGTFDEGTGCVWSDIYWEGALVGGALIAIVAQAGDFFESWMKRRARVKDSGKLIPGHGGLFDRVDGLLSVSFVMGLFFLVSGAFEWL
ncbi:MAG TPA: phosphatidate cytidylyltransferase [Novosphingobium sp.]|nr:phosphatidate cytidylyltransferase [Novosphingobium sp.]